MPDLSEYKGLHVRKTAGDPSDPAAVWYGDHITGEMSLKPFGGATFLNELSQPTEEAPEKIILGTDYVEREPWIEQVGLDRKIVPAGPSHDRMRETHNFPECKELVFHMLQHDYRYQVVQQPGRLSETDVAHYYLAVLVKVEDPTGFDRSTGWVRVGGSERAPEYVSAGG